MADGEIGESDIQCTLLASSLGVYFENSRIAAVLEIENDSVVGKRTECSEASHLTGEFFIRTIRC